MIFGLTIIPLLGIVGLAIDFGRLMVKRNIAQMAADASVLQAAGVTRDRLKDFEVTAVLSALAIAEGEEAGRQMFNAYMSKNRITGVTPDVKVTVSELSISATANYAVSNQNTLGSLFGVNTFTAQGDAKSGSSLPYYVDLHVAVDASPSMGIAATTADMIKLFNAEVPLKAYPNNSKPSGTVGKVSCVFGCHTDAHWVYPRPIKTMSQTASDVGVKLRINVLRDAVAAMIDKAKNTPDGSTHYRIALSKLGLDPSGETTLIQGMTNQFDVLKQKAQTIDMAQGNTGYVSYISESITDLANKHTAAGNGTTRTAAKKFAFIITDGAVGRNGPPPSGYKGTCGKHHSPPNNGYFCSVDTSGCAALKAKGVTVGVIYTTYFPIMKDPANPSGPYNEDYIVSLQGNGITPKMKPALEACASPGWFYEASDDQSISVALNKMFDQASSAPSLTQ